jgi:hypothetical protein
MNARDFFVAGCRTAQDLPQWGEKGRVFPQQSDETGGCAMAMVRKAGWFVVVAVMMAGWMGVLGSVRGVAEAGVIASSFSDMGNRAEDMAKVQAFLENKLVVQKLVDYGVSPAEAMAKAQEMSAQDLHRLASLTDRAAAGTDSFLGVLIALAILVILFIVIMKLLNKEVVVR